MWDLGNKSLSVLFSLPVFLYCLSWGLLPLSGEGKKLARAAWAGLSSSWSRQGAGTHLAASPFFPPSPPLRRAAKGHTVKLLAEGKQSCRDSAKPALEEQHCPGPANTWATAAEQVTQAGSAAA